MRSVDPFPAPRQGAFNDYNRGSETMDTANVAQAFLRRQNAQQLLSDALSRFAPTDDEMARVNTLAALALSRVARDHRLTLPEDETPEVRRLFDSAECGVFYGYVMGLAAAQQAAGD